MIIRKQIEGYINSQPESKRTEILELHQRIIKAIPQCRVWFNNGKDGEGKTVTNPGIGYGCYTIKYADGRAREFYQIGLSGNKTGLSVYILGLKDKTYLSQTFGKKIGKASVTGYCIKFKTLKDIDVDVLIEAIRYGVEAN
jgi:hypothetical protein